MPGARWSKAEIRSLKRQVKTEGRAIEEVEVPGRSVHAIRRQAARLEWISQRPGRFKWPQKQVDKLCELANQGLSAAEIHQFELLGKPDRSLWAIRKMWGRLNLADPQRAAQMRQRKVWQPGERKKFDAFLRRNSKSMTPEEIGLQWDCARSTVARRQTELGLKRSRQEVLQMAYSQSKREEARKRLSERNLQYWRERREQREQELEALADEYRKRRGPSEQVCVDCERTWPRRREFFHTSEKQISIGTSRYFKHRCVLCENKRRRQKDQRKAEALEEAAAVACG